METRSSVKRKRELRKKDREVLFRTGIKGKDFEGVSALIYHDDGEDGLTEDEVVELLSEVDEESEYVDTRLTTLCYANQLPLVTLFTEFLKQKNRFEALDVPSGDGATPLASLAKRDVAR